MQGSYSHTHDNNAIDETVQRLGNLSESDRAVLGLYYYEELTTSEIAEVLEIEASEVEETLNDIMSRMENTGDSQNSEEENKTSSYTSH